MPAAWPGHVPALVLVLVLVAAAVVVLLLSAAALCGPCRAVARVDGRSRR
jgi:hypothetical protein